MIQTPFRHLPGPAHRGQDWRWRAKLGRVRRMCPTSVETTCHDGRVSEFRQGVRHLPLVKLFDLVRNLLELRNGIAG